MGGGGLGDEGGAGRDLEGRQDADPGVVAEDREREEPAQDGSEGVVEIRDGEFTPGTVKIPPRSVVTFLNRDDVARAIDFEDERLDDAEVGAGGAHTVEVPAEGSFPFSVDDNEGKVVVVPE